MPYEDEIKQLTASIWETMLQLPIDAEVSAAKAGGRTLSACVQITGSWRGAVSLSCDLALAAQAAGIMFGLDEADRKTSDMQDAVGELANMIGGNVKALLPEACQLSLPSVVEGFDYSMRIPGAKLVTQIPMRCGEHALSVSLLESEAKAA